MVGNIGTGKTTTAERLMATNNIGDNCCTKIISNDDLAIILTKNHCNTNTWDNRHIHFYSTIKRHIVREALTHGFDIIVDGTHMRKIDRKAYIDIAKEFDIKIVVYLHTYSKGLQRRIAEPKSNHVTAAQWTTIYNNFAEMYEKPSLDEGIDNILEIEGRKNRG